jgi:hypothetical protein
MVYNPSYLGGIDQENQGYRLAQAKKLVKSISTTWAWWFVPGTPNKQQQA